MCSWQAESDSTDCRSEPDVDLDYCNDGQILEPWHSKVVQCHLVTYTQNFMGSKPETAWKHLELLPACVKSIRGFILQTYRL